MYRGIEIRIVCLRKKTYIMFGVVVIAVAVVHVLVVCFFVSLFGGYVIVVLLMLLLMLCVCVCACECVFVCVCVCVCVCEEATVEAIAKEPH